ncbi:hypothetical protein [Micromonospora sp. NPDC005652]|uniref:hypothetical protein n=1 Tax=Micromonospora sp. NPDC005652 TaxID=3157046 RepID=UPI0033FA90F9
MSEQIAARLADMDGEALYAALRDGSLPRDQVQAEIVRREMQALPLAVVEGLASSEALGPELVLGVVGVVFETEWYDDGYAWGTVATVVPRPGHPLSPVAGVVTVDFDRTGAADALVELSEHAERPLTYRDTLSLDLTSALVQWRAKQP